MPRRSTPRCWRPKRWRAALQHALEAGALLNQAKARIAHGKWNEWLAVNCQVAPRTARGYMRLATAYPTLPESEPQRVADLPVREAVKAIATHPSPPARPRAALGANREDSDRVVERFQATAKIVREASRWISHGKPLEGGKVTTLRNQLQAILSELDPLQGRDAA
ncbi:DUF3102 domain-containing protein [Variovorax sp. RTB1]|uniref:DUF3102 domain-containing protein n=1 Tax=Variovorax sp. RTB1 TaxID=3048631 RepID=UPI002B225D00|nr:DUF3102 domain-containing protein [Variovorax sp. RTB1]MEB0112786.1 DUF3102 domain-containing protein [Variovorax sp. RTB1]